MTIKNKRKYVVVGHSVGSTCGGPTSSHVRSGGVCSETRTGVSSSVRTSNTKSEQKRITEASRDNKAQNKRGKTAKAGAAPPSFMARLKERARRPFKDTSRILDLANNGEQYYDKGNALAARTVLVSKQLHLDLISLNKLLRSLGKKWRYVAAPGGFTKKVKSYVYNKRLPILVRKVQNHCANMGVRIPPFKGYDSFIKNVVSRVPELHFVNNNVHNIAYTNSFDLNINNVAAYDQAYCPELDVVVDSRTVRINNSFLYNKKIKLNFDKLMMINKVNNNNNKFKMTHHKRKANMNKFNISNIGDFPLLQKDQPYKKKEVKKLAKHLAIIPRIVVTPPEEDRKSWRDALLKKREEKRRLKEGPSLEDLLKPQENQPSAPPVTFDERRLIWVFQKIHQPGKCWYCCVIKYNGSLPRKQVRDILRLYSCCTCCAVQQSDDKDNKGMFTTMKDLLSGTTTAEAKKLFDHPVLDRISRFSEPETVDQLVWSLNKLDLAPTEKIDALKNLTAQMVNVTENFKEATERICDTSDNIRGISERAFTTLREYNGRIDAQAVYERRLCQLVGVVLSIPLYYELDWNGRLLLFASQVCLMSLPVDVYYAMRHAFFGLVARSGLQMACQHGDSATQQSDDIDFSKMVGPISQIVSLGLVSATATTDADTVKSLVQMGNLARSFKNVTSFSDAVQTGIQESSKTLFSIVTGLPSELQTNGETIEGLDNWLEAISLTVENPEWVASYLRDVQNEKILEQLISSGTLIASRIARPDGQGNSQQLHRYVSTTVATLRKMCTAIKAARAGSKDRILPVAVLFSGPPGVGKTYVINQMVVDLMALQDDDYKSRFKSLDEMKYTKSPTSDYYDGYLDHFVYVQDEVFQSTDPQKKVKDIDQIMGLIQESSAPLDMARLEGKGTVYFQSRYVMFTTNKQNLTKDLPMVAPSAIRRRLHNIIKIEIADQFKIGDKLDVGKWLAFARANRLNPKHPNYARFHVRTVGNRQDLILTYRQLLQHLHSQFLRNQERFREIQDTQKHVERGEFDPVEDIQADIVFSGNCYAWPEARQQADEEPQEYIPEPLPEHPSDSMSLCCGECKVASSLCPRLQKIKQRYSDLLLEKGRAGPHDIWHYWCLCEGTCLYGTWTECITRGILELKPSEAVHLRQKVSVSDHLKQCLQKIQKQAYARKPASIEEAKIRLSYDEGSDHSPEDTIKMFQTFRVLTIDELIMYSYIHRVFPGKDNAAKRSKAFYEAFSRPYTEPTFTPEQEKEKLEELAKFLGCPMVSRFKMVLRSFLAKVKKHPYFSAMIFLTSAGLLVGGIMAFVKWRSRKDLTKEEAAVYDSAKDKGKRNTRFIPTLSKAQEEEVGSLVNGFDFNISVAEPSIELNHAEEQAWADSNWESQMMRVIGNLICVAYADDIGISDNVTRVRGILVDNDYALIPRHGIKGRDGYLKITRGAISFTVAVKDLEMLEIGERWGYNDVVLVKFPQNKAGGVRPIVSLFCSEKELEQFHDGWGELLVVDRDKKIVTRHASRIETDFKQPEYVKTASGNIMYLAKGFRYSAATASGDCGSPLVRWDPSARGKILGLHVAGKQDGRASAYSCRVDREWIEQGIQELGSPVAIETGDETPLSSNSFEVIPEMDVVGHTDQRTQLPLGPSVYVPSPFAEYRFKPFSTAPAVRTANGPESSLALVLKKFKREAPYVDRDLIRKITMCISLKVRSPEVSTRIFTYDEALNVLDTVRSIDLSTSMGFPWSRQQRKKKDYVGYDESAQKFYFLNDEIPKRCLENENKIKQRDGRDFVFVNSLKDERLPLEAVARKKVRLFMVCPFDLTLMVRKFFGSYIERIHQLKFDLGVCVGIDPHSDQWGNLALSLLRYSDEFYEIDYSNWDRSIPMEFLGVFFDVADYFYQDEHKEIRRYIRAAILNPTYQLKYFRYKVLSGNPSGCPVTTELNSIANLAMTIYVICQQGYSPSTVFDNTFVATYGDDSLISTAIPVTPDQLRAGIKDLGLIATGANKDEPVLRKPIHEVQFLKRKFIFFQGQYFAPLKMDSIMESLMWMRRGENQKYNFTQTIRNAMTALEQYNPSDVTQQYIRIIEFSRRCNFKVEVSEHCMASLMPVAESESAILENMFIKMSLAMYRMFVRINKVPVDLASLPPSMDVDYCGFDLATKTLGISKGYFFHVGFRSKDWEMELTFSDKGVVWIPPDYTPSFSVPVTIQREALLDSSRHGPYHLVRNNCIDYCERTLGDSNQIHLLPEEIRMIGSNLKRKTLRENSFLWAEQQSDDITETNADTKHVTFMESQQITSGQEIRSIEQLLGTDTLLESKNWKENTPHDGELFEVKLPGKLQVVKQFECKLKFSALLRADVRVRVEVSALKLYAGSLIVYWVPCANKGLPTGMEITAKQATGMTHAMVRLPDTPAVEIVIPFTHYKNFVSQTKYDDDEIGTLFVKVMNPLSPPKDGGKDVLVKILANFVNVQAIITTPLTKESTWVGGEKIYPRFSKSQGQDEPEEKAERGIISGPATTVARVAQLVGGIPVFSGIASSVRVMAETVASVATFIGLSKPRNLQATQPVSLGVFSNVGHSDALDNGKVLAMNPKNSVVIQPSLFGSLEDQLNINCVVRKPCLVLIKYWSVVESEGKTLMIIPIHPCIGSPHEVAGKHMPLQMSYMGYVASCFKYWRGTIKLKFEVIATGFHAGSLIAGFIPRGSIDGDNEFSYETTLKEIIIVDGYSITEIEIPFISTAMLNFVGNPYDTIDLASNHATGTLVLKVEKPLMSSGVASDTVQINVWACAGSDFQLSYPHLGNVGNFSYTGKEVISEGLNIRPTVGPRPDLVIGEEIHSLRDLLKISVLKYETSRTFGAGVSEITLPAHTFSGDDTVAEVHDTYYSHLMRLYRFSRGSIRHKVMFGSIEAKVSAISSLGNKDEYVWKFTRTPEGSPWTTTHGKMNSTLEYEIPFYNAYKMEVHGDESSYRGAVLQFEKLNDTPENSHVNVYESIGDDFSAGYLMGPPLVFQKRTILYSILHAVKNASKEAAYVDEYYDFTSSSRKEIKIKLKSGTTTVVDSVSQQLFYYVSHMPKYAMYVADADVTLGRYFYSSKRNYGHQFSKLVCVIRRDKATYTTASLSYETAETPLNGIWFGIHVTTTGVQFYTCNLKQSGLRNIKRVLLKADLLTELLGPMKIFIGRVLTDY